MKRFTRTFFCTAGLLAAAFVAGCGGGHARDPILGIPPAALVSITVTPAAPSIPVSYIQQFSATANYADGSSRNVTTASTWTSATIAVATVNAATGAAKGIAAGTSLISASFGGMSGSATLTVRPATLASIAIAPLNPSIARGLTQQFTVLGTFSDATTRDITAVSSFTSATVAVATIGASGGLATGVAPGTSVITATSGGLSASTTLTVTPVVLLSLAITPANPFIQIGADCQLTVTASYSDGTTADVTTLALYATANPASVTINGSGLAVGVAAGSSVITATFGGKATTTLVTVSSATLTSIAVIPATAAIGVAETRQFIAIGTYSDNTTGSVSSSSTWTSGSPAVATVLAGGIATGVSPGTATITATLAGKSGSGVLTVNAGPATVNLGGATSFAVLAGTSLTNNAGGTTVVSGDVGSPSQTVPPVQSSGTNYTAGAILNGALADLQTAITDANSRTCGSNTAAGINLGGLVMTPGVYCITGPISLTGNLTLNGPGVYIIRTASTLDTTANSSIFLTNGATADQVFWVPVAATTLGANSAFKGSILSKNAAITLGDNATMLNGRVLSGAAVTLSNNQITK